jgi:hypothetical protein
VDGIGEPIEQTGAALCYLFLYSPDFDPLEKCRAQVKQKLRALKTRSLAVLQHALPEALSTVSYQTNGLTCHPGARISAPHLEPNMLTFVIAIERAGQCR